MAEVSRGRLSKEPDNRIWIRIFTIMCKMSYSVFGTLVKPHVGQHRCVYLVIIKFTVCHKYTMVGLNGSSKHPDLVCQNQNLTPRPTPHPSPKTLHTHTQADCVDSGLSSPLKLKAALRRSGQVDCGVIAVPGLGGGWVRVLCHLLPTL